MSFPGFGKKSRKAAAGGRRCFFPGVFSCLQKQEHLQYHLIPTKRSFFGKANGAIANHQLKKQNKYKNKQQKHTHKKKQEKHCFFSFQCLVFFFPEARSSQQNLKLCFIHNPQKTSNSRAQHSKTTENLRGEREREKQTPKKTLRHKQKHRKP